MEITWISEANKKEKCDKYKECEACPFDASFSNLHWRSRGYFCKIDDFKQGLIKDSQIIEYDNEKLAEEEKALIDIFLFSSSHYNLFDTQIKVLARTLRKPQDLYDKIKKMRDNAKTTLNEDKGTGSDYINYTCEATIDTCNTILSLMKEMGLLINE